MTSSIPASELVNSIPSVLGVGGTPQSTNGLFVTNNITIPIGTVQEFPDAAAVEAWFGANSNQAALANVYFGGYIGGSAVPGLLYFTQYNTTAVAGYMRGGSLASLTLTQLQLLSGTITVALNGTSTTSAAINLSSATSFSDAATLIQAGLQAGTPTNTATVTYDALQNAFVITSSTTGAGSSVGYGTDTSLSPSLFFTQATGAVLSPGAAASTPAATMAAAVQANSNWTTFTTDYNATPTDMLAFAAWANTTTNKVYIGYDNSTAPTEGSAPSSFGAQVATYNGVIALYNPSGLVAALIAGITASLNFNAKNGRITYAFKGQAGLVPDVTTATAAQNLIANGYNFYGQYATSSQQFQFLQPGSISGNWKWIDSYVDQIYFNSLFTADLLTFLSQIGAVPYNSAGYALVAESLSSAIKQMGDFGAYVTGVSLSGTQIAAINAQVGTNVAPQLTANGYYLQVSDPGPTARANRQSPIVNFYYTDGGSIQQISINSVEVQ